MRIIAAAAEDVPHFESQAFLVSNAAYDAGFKSLKDFPGHTFALSQIGSSAQYALGLIADKYGFALGTVRILPLQSIANAVTAVAGGRADITLNSATAELAAVQHGSARILGYLGDEKSYQFGVVFTATTTANDRPDIVARFLRAYRKGARDYHDAFAGPNGDAKGRADRRRDLAILRQIRDRAAGRARGGRVLYRCRARLDVPDVLHQVAWYKSQNLLKADVDANALIDRRYVIALPAR